MNNLLIYNVKCLSGKQLVRIQQGKNNLKVACLTNINNKNKKINTIEQIENKFNKTQTNLAEIKKFKK